MSTVKKTTKKSQENTYEDIANGHSIVMNNTFGWMQLFNEQTNKKYPTLKKYAQTVRCFNSDVIDMMTNLSDLFTEAYVLIKNPELVDFLGLTETYKYVLFSEDEVDVLLSKSEAEITEFFNKAPRGQKALLLKIVKVKTERGDSVVDSSSKMAFLEKLFGVKYSDYYNEPQENLKR